MWHAEVGRVALSMYRGPFPPTAAVLGYPSLDLGLYFRGTKYMQRGPPYQNAHRPFTLQGFQAICLTAAACGRY